jgi:acetyl-CoA acetyltransferase (EC 2.3.1.9)
MALFICAEVGMKDVVIVGAVRTPIGCFQGALSRFSAVELGSVVVQALVERTGLDPMTVDEVILGTGADRRSRGKTLRVSRPSKADCQTPYRPSPLTTSAVPA